MKEISKYVVLTLLFVWELPQNLLGLLVYVIMKSRKKIVHAVPEAHRLFIQTPNTGVSLGWFIFWTPAGNRFTYLNNDCRMHEYGHARQSAMLGPTYLIVVGIPSITRVIYRKWYRKIFSQDWKNYFNGFPENWADRLGGIMVSKINNS